MAWREEKLSPPPYHFTLQASLKLMKTSRFVAALLRPVFATLAALSTSAAISHATETSEVITETDPVTIAGTAGTNYSNSITVDQDDMLNGTLTALSIAGTSNSYGACAQVFVISASSSIQASADSGTVYGIELNEFASVSTSYASISVNLGDDSTQASPGIAVGVWNDGYYNTHTLESGLSSYQVTAGENAVAMGLVNSADRTTKVGALIQMQASVGNIKTDITATSTATSAINSNYKFASVGIWNQSDSFISNIDAVSTITALAQTGAGASVAIQNDGAITSSSATIISTNTAGNATGIYNDGSIGSIGMAANADGASGIIVSSAATSWGIHNQGTIGSIDTDIKVSSSSSSNQSYGIYNEGIIGSTDSDKDAIAGSITVTGEGDASFGVYNVEATTGSITADIKATALGGDALGIDNERGIIKAIDSTLVVESVKGLAFGINNYYGSIGSVSGEIIVSSTGAFYNKEVYGISNSGTMGAIRADISATAAGYGSVYGIESSGSLGDISGTISATSSSKSFSSSIYDANAYGLYLGSDSSVGTISAAISATSGASYTGSTAGTHGNATAFYTESAQDLVFAEGASLTATTQGTGNAYGLQFDSGTKNDSISFGAGVDVTASATGTGNATAVYTYNYYGEVTLDLGEGAQLSASVADETAQAFGVVAASALRIEASGDASISAMASSETATTKAISANKTLTVATAGTLNITGDVVVNSGSYDGAGMGAFTVEQGKVAISSGSQVLADSITINSGATLALVIADDDTISSSSVTNNGTLSLSAGTTLKDGDYALSSNSGLTVGGTVKTYGGSLSGNTFTVAEAKTLVLDATSGSATVGANGRLVVTNSDSSTSIVMNFNSSTDTIVKAVTTVTDKTSITGSATIQSFADFAAASMTGNLEIAEAYHFDIEMLNGATVELIFYVGEEVTADDIAIFHLADTEGAEWSTSDQLTDFSLSDGYLTVYTDSFSSIGYAFSTVPEPSTATLSLLALAGLCARRRRRTV